jgi:hypothetical protein
MWGPVREQVEKDDPAFRRNKDFTRDMFNVVVGIVAQTCLVAAPIFLVIRETLSLTATVLVFALSAAILKKTWYDNLEQSQAHQHAAILSVNA